MPETPPAMRGIRLSDRCLIAGQTGKGKTTLMLWLLERLQPIRTIVMDPKACLSFPGVAPVGTPEALPEALRGRLCHYVPASFDRKALEDASAIIWNTPGPYLLAIDETSELSTPNYVPEGIRLNVTQGREPRKMVIACTQRLAESHPVFRSQSEHIFIFTPPPVELDLKAISGNVRREARLLERELSALHAEEGDFSHLWYCRDTDELRRCAPIPLAGTASPAPADGGEEGRAPAQAGAEAKDSPA